MTRFIALAGASLFVLATLAPQARADDPPKLPTAAQTGGGQGDAGFSAAAGQDSAFL